MAQRQSFGRGWFSLLLLLGLAYMGYFKGTVLLVWLGFDLTLPLLLFVSAHVLHCVVSSRSYGLRQLAPVIALWCTFVPGAIVAATSQFSFYKSAYLFTITLVICMSAVLVLSTPQAQRRWIFATLVSGVVLVLVVVVSPDVIYQRTYGRLSVEGSSTIGVARVVGAAFVVASFAGLLSLGRRRVAYLVLAGACGGALLLIGSRGPLASGLLAIGIALLTARRVRPRRFASAAVGALGAGLFIWIALVSDSPGGRRLAAFLSGENPDVVRQELLATALSSIPSHPLGVGWGGFPSLLSGSSQGAGVYPHNLFVEVTLEGGWLAGVALLLFTGVAMRRLHGNSSSVNGAILFALAVYWLAVAQTSSDLNGNRVTLMMLAVGIAMGVTRGRFALKAS